MSDWWYLLVALAVIAIAAVVVMRGRRASVAQTGTIDSARDYGAERETGRLDSMSAEDREWEAASLERSRQSRETSPPSD